jgi:site-specific DNA recombinase
LRGPPPRAIFAGFPMPALEDPMRTVIYARFSSHLQNSRSCADQVADCRKRAEREGWEVVGVFADDAISGAAGIGEDERPGLSSALRLIETGQADQLLAESTDRIARHQGDAFAVRERLEFAGARLFTLLDGVVDDITGTIKGLFDARFRKDLGARIRRGQRGAVSEGRSPAGLAFGYRIANRLDGKGGLVRGLREVVPAEAAIVLRIFREYAAGHSPRAIAERLNAEGVPGPRGGTWRTSTIAGDRVRQNGMLQNRLYAGVIVHNRTKKITDPKTRRTLIKALPESDWVSEPAEQLRIVDEDLWMAVQAMRRRFSQHQHPERARRAKHMLSGLAICGVCGGAWNVIGLGRWGCGRHRDGRGCSNGRTIVSAELERRVLAGLQHQLLHPDLVAAFVKEYHLDYARRARTLERDRGGLERRHAAAAAKVGNLVDAIAGGADQFAEVRAALASATHERDALAGQLANLDAAPIVRLHPGIADDYRRQVAQLADAMANSYGRVEAMPVLRSLIDAIVVTPKADAARGVDLEVRGRLAAIIALATGQPAPAGECMPTVERVKGAGRYHTFLKAAC